jgi:uncharacterized protein (DUF433 family)
MSQMLDIQPVETTGIDFEEGWGRRVAVIAGTHLPVSEVIMVYLDHQNDMDATARHLSHLSRSEIEAAVRYFTMHPCEIEGEIEEMRRIPHTGPGMMTLDEWKAGREHRA